MKFIFLHVHVFIGRCFDLCKLCKLWSIVKYFLHFSWETESTAAGSSDVSFNTALVRILSSANTRYQWWIRTSQPNSSIMVTPEIWCNSVAGWPCIIIIESHSASTQHLAHCCSHIQLSRSDWELFKTGMLRDGQVGWEVVVVPGTRGRNVRLSANYSS